MKMSGGIAILLFVGLLPFWLYSAANDLDLIFSELEQKRELPAGILRKICHAESRCSATARSNTSSAAGIFQWLDGSWQQTTRLMHQNRSICPSGCPFRLEHRFNPAIAAEVTAFALNQMKIRLGGLIQQAGADMTTGLYMAHFLGEGGARKFFTAFIQNPNQNAAQLFPRAAAANSSIFRGRSLAGVYALMAQKLGQTPLTTGVTGTFRDAEGRLLVDNPSLYARDILDTTATIPTTESELDYQTNYANWVPQAPSQSSQQPASSPSSLPLAQPNYIPPPQYTPQYLGSAFDLNKLFSSATSTPTYVSIEKGVNYFENIIGTSTRQTSPFTVNTDLEHTGTVKETKTGTVSVSPVDSTGLPAINTFGKANDTFVIENPATIGVIAAIIHEVQALLQKIAALIR